MACGTAAPRAVSHPGGAWHRLLSRRFVMRMPFKTESDAFRVAAALGLVGAASLLLGLLTTRAYGIVLFSAGVAAGVVFELAGRERDRGAELREASHAPHPHGATAGQRHVLVVAGETLAGERLAQELGAGGGVQIELDVLAPILASRSHQLAGDIDRERADAQRRLEDSLAWARKHGFAAKGEVGDEDPLTGIEDELRDFGADEVVIVRHGGERRSWLANRMLGYLARELEMPVREVVVGDEHGRPLPPHPPSS
jgi:hypothetical protein